MDRKGFMFAPPVFGDGMFRPFQPPAARAPALPAPPVLGQAPAESPAAAADRTGRTGTEMITIVVLGLAVLAALEAVGVTDILGRKPKRGRASRY